MKGELRCSSPLFFVIFFLWKKKSVFVFFFLPVLLFSSPKGSLFPFFLVYLLFFSLLFSKGERNHRGTKKKVSPSTFARVSSFGSFASVSFASGKNKGRKKSSFPQRGNRKEKNQSIAKGNTVCLLFLPFCFPSFYQR